MGKLPAFQFYPADWRKDLAVQSLDYHDKGVWFEMLCLMHESGERGKLLLNGQKISEDSLARLLGLDKQILTSTLTTLITSGVAKVEQTTGVIYSKRMVEDENLRQIRSEAGKQGGNPLLLKQNPTTRVKQKPTPSSSSSSSSTSKKEEELRGASSDAEPEIDPECKPVDQRKSHPAIVAIREVTNRYPPKEIWDELIDQIGFDADTVRLRKCYAAWIGYGYNRTNFNWVYDWYVSDRIPKTGEKNGTHRSNQNGKRDTSTDRIAATADIYSKYPTEAELAGQS